MKDPIIVDKKDSKGKNLSCLTRRKFIKAIGVGAAGIGTGIFLGRFNFTRENKTESFIASVSDYQIDLSLEILRGFQELGIKGSQIKNKKVLLKPNLVEPHRQLEHFNTHPLVIRGAVEAFLSLGASEVIVAEGAGHRRVDRHCRLV